jgi:2-polyprenyl-3-methyl-5-hydroxy-6-metoxy-1,4-benzoquinol methylase
MKNEDLKEIYNNPEFSNTFSSFEESLAILHMRDDWEGKKVLEIGCGEGDLCALLNMAGAKVYGIDCSGRKIDIADKHYPCLLFEENDYKYITKYSADIVVMQGVLEHLNTPFTELKWIIDNLVVEKGCVITSSPCFVNPRGYVWMTIEMLFDIKMSLTDLHNLNPWDFEKFCHEFGYSLKTEYCDYDWGAGEKTIIDFNKRMKSDTWKEKFKKATGRVLEDNKIDEFLNWLEKALQAEEFSNLGANAIYEISK